MDNNDILRRLRYAFDYQDSKVIDIFKLGGSSVNRDQLILWLKKDVEPDYIALPGNYLSAFLNGLIIEKRGKKEGVQPVIDKQLNNNVIFRKIRIALNLTDEDIQEILKLADLQISKPEINAFFRNPSQGQFRECKDQILRNFIRGLQIKYRETKKDGLIFFQTN